MAITEAAERAATLTAQLLAFGRQHKVTVRTLDLNAAVNTIEPMLQQLIGENVRLVLKLDPAAGHISMVPFHDRIIETAAETTIRVLLEVLADPRTDELFSDVLRDNLQQIRTTVREREKK